MVAKLVKNNKVVRFPRSFSNVITLLETVLKQARTRKIKKCIIVCIDENGNVITAHNGGRNTEIVGILEVAKLNFYNKLD